MTSHSPDNDMRDFNLITQPWIPILRHDGRCELASIETALAAADDIRQFACPNPMDRFALLRLFLGVLYWSAGPPPSDFDGTVASLAPALSGCLGTLHRHKACFNLLGDGPRFFQDSTVRSKRPEHTVNYLIHEVPSGSNKWHFRHVADMKDGLCPACCALGLLRLPVFATSAGRGKSPGLNSKPPGYVLPVGHSLADTLAGLWQSLPQNMQLGRPAWDSTGHSLPAGGQVPLLDGFTWLPRRVWLADPEDPAAPCACCGRIQPLVRKCVFEGRKIPDSIKWRDPHVIYVPSKKGGETSGIPIRNAAKEKNIDAESDHWAACIAALLASPLARTARPVWIIVFCTAQNDKYLETLEYTVRLPAPDARKGLSDFLEFWRDHSNRLRGQKGLLARIVDAPANPHRTAGRPSGAKPSRKHTEISLLDLFRPQIEAAVSAAVMSDAQSVLAAPASDLFAGQYRPVLKTLGSALCPGPAVRAEQLRRRILDAAVPEPPRESSRRKKKEESQ